MCGAWAARRVGLPVVAHYQTDLLAYARAYGGKPPGAGRRGGRAPLLQPLRPRLRADPADGGRAPAAGIQTGPGQRSGDGHAGSSAPGRPGTVQARDRWPQGEGPRILCVCRLAREKGLDRVVRIARGRPELSFLVVGAGPLEEELRRLAPANLRLAGLLEGEALADVFAAGDVFLHPASTETFGQAIQEAMASGLPVVGIRAGGAAWLVEEGRTGMLAEPPGDGLGAVLDGWCGGRISRS